MNEKLCAGVTMLVERMQTHPEDFEYGGKLHGYMSSVEELLVTPTAHQPFWYLSGAERNALVEAYRNMHKAAFTANVVQAILSPAPEYNINMDMPYQEAVRLDASGNLGLGVNAPSKMIAPAYMVKQATELLEKQYEKQYVKNYAKTNRR